MSLQENQEDKKFLIFEDQFKLHINEEKVSSLHKDKDYWLWSDRLVLIEDDHDEEFWNFIIFDLLMNEERPARLSKSNTHFSRINIILMPNDFAFILECPHFALETNTRSVNLIRIDWNAKNQEFFQRVDTFQRDYIFFYILFSRHESKKFLLIYAQIDNRTITYEKFKLSREEKLEFNGEVYRSQTLFCFYFNDKLVRVRKPKITLYDLNTKKEEQTYYIDSSLFQSGSLIWHNNFGECVQDRFYACVRFRGIERVVWTDLKEKRWNLFDTFQTCVEIRDFELVDGNMLICSQQRGKKTNDGVCKSVVEAYKIPMRRPNYLRKMAWILTVKVMEKRGEKDPYKAAKEFLPLNSDLRSFWFKDEEKKKETIEEGVPVKKLKPN